jgi:hypothetical protein
MYGLNGGQSPETLEKLAKMGIVNDQIQSIGQGSVANGVDVMPMFEDVDSKFEKENVTPDVAKELKEFIRKKTEAANYQFNQSTEYTDVISTNLSKF